MAAAVDLVLQLKEALAGAELAEQVGHRRAARAGGDRGYGLEFDGVPIERLSPGTGGIVLLLLYLAVDTVAGTIYRDSSP
jgi:hypothetical protein